jgi:tRNA(fMet)-specific endonuclease VapC
MERARLDRVGKTAPFVEGQIASIALVHNLALVTKNVRDFVSFIGLRVEDWGGGK